MKQKYAAMVLGLALVVSSMSVFAASVDTEADASVESSTELNDISAGEEYYGEITEIGDNSITVSLGTLKEENVEASDTEENADLTEGTDDAEDSDSGASVDSEDAEADGTDTAAGLDLSSDNVESLNSDVLDYTGDELTVTLTEDTLVLTESLGTVPAQEVSDVALGEEVSEDSSENTEESSEDTNTATNTDSEAPQEITFEDLMVGDVVKVNFDENGETAAVTVLTTTENAELFLGDELSEASDEETETSDVEDTTDAVE